MERLDLSAIKIMEGMNSLTGTQPEQFKRVIMQGLKGKFVKALRDDTGGMLKIIDIWIKYRYLPMKETYCAIDEASNDVLGILLLNDFYIPNFREAVLCLFSVCRAIGINKALKIAFNFLELDNLNKDIGQNDNVASEIYLISIREDMRGNGIGTLLMDHALKMISRNCKCGSKDNCKCRVKLIVYAKNPARRLYERFGFTEAFSIVTPKIAKAFGDDYDTFVSMEKPLMP